MGGVDLGMMDTPTRLFQYAEAQLNLQAYLLGRRPGDAPRTQRADAPRTFSADRRDHGHTWVTRHLEGDPVVVVEADPQRFSRDDGSYSIGVGFPVLIVAPCVKDPEAFAARVARLLTTDGYF